MKQKLKVSALLLPVFFFSGLHAQQSVTSGGGDGSGSGGTVAYSVGQVAFTSATGASGSINQGVQQAYEVSTVGIDKNANVNLFVSAYPNPVESQLHLKVTDENLGSATYALYDAGGKLVRQQDLKGTETLIEMQELTNGVYFLKVSDNKELIKTFQIIKHN